MPSADAVVGPAPLVVRLRVDGDDFAEMLPPVPAGHAVSVSFSGEPGRGDEAGVLDALGYRVVGRVSWDPRSTDGTWIDMLVSGQMRVQHAAWCRAVLTLADRAYDLSLGPVRTLLSRLVAAHGAPPHPR